MSHKIGEGGRRRVFFGQMIWRFRIWMEEMMKMRR
jgi:hypothetical protein